MWGKSVFRGGSCTTIDANASGFDVISKLLMIQSCRGSQCVGFRRESSSCSEKDHGFYEEARLTQNGTQTSYARVTANALGKGTLYPSYARVHVHTFQKGELDSSSGTS